MKETHATVSDLPKHWIGIELGWKQKNKDPWQSLISLPPHQLAVHGLLVGSSGSGKTTLIHHLIAQDIIENHSLCILDLRGDLVGATLELCAQNVDPARVRIIDLREKARPTGFNPLSGKGEPYFRALNVLDAVAKNSESWGVQLAETLRSALMLLAEAQEPLTELESVFYDRAFRTQCLGRCKTPSVTSFWERFDQLSADKQSSLASPVMNKVSLLFATETLRQVLGHSNPIDLGEHLNTPGSILLVSLAADEVHSAGTMMGNLILSSICREIFARVSIPEKLRNPVRLIVDEFEHFGTDDFEAILAEGRKFKFSVVLAHQTLAQLTPKMRAIILNNVGTKVFFRCGREDATTLSRDLSGDPKEFDLCALPTGVAVLWRRGQQSIHVEINEPILNGEVGLSSQAEAFRTAVYEGAGPHVDTPRFASDAKSQEDEKSDKKRRTKKVPPPSFLKEDWL